jgi:hypothetical protein
MSFRTNTRDLFDGDDTDEHTGSRPLTLKRRIKDLIKADNACVHPSKLGYGIDISAVIRRSSDSSVSRALNWSYINEKGL